MRNKRVAATFALLAVTFALFFTIVLVGLIGNAVQKNMHMTDLTETEKTQYKLLITILAIASFNMIYCMLFFVMYIRVFFSSSTRQSSRS
jgi:Na+/alanine symporter